MYPLITLPNDVETSLIDTLYDGIDKKSYMITKNELLKIPQISSFERINFYLFKKYAVSILDGIETFEEQTSVELKEMCRSIINYCKS